MKSKFYALSQLMLCLLVSWHAAISQTPKIVKVGCSEYRAFYLCDDKKAYAALWNGAVNANTCQAMDIPNPVVDINGGLYQGVAVDDKGYAYQLSNSKTTPTIADVDSKGNPFTGNVKCYAYSMSNFTIKSDGTIWTWGDNVYQLDGTKNTIAKPIQLNAPNGVKFTKLSCGDKMLALTTTGDVYEYTKGNVNPVKINLPKPASDIASGNMWQIAIIPDDITKSTDGWPYGWATWATYIGLTGTVTTPTALKGTWGMTSPIRKITANYSTTHFIDVNGQLWGMGNNAAGEVGIGSEKINHAETYATPYIWDWVVNGDMVSKPVKIAEGITFKEIYTGGTYAFYHYAIADNGDIYSWGRNKALVLGNGKAINQEAYIPNALDVLKPMLVTPMTQKANGYDFKLYTCNVGTDQTITLPTSTVSVAGVATPSTGYTIASYKWIKITGPNTYNIESPSSAKTDISGLGAGVYTFRMQMTDNNTATISDTLQITVLNSSAPINQTPVAKSNGNQKKTLPDNTVSLDGSTSYDPDGTIASWKWEYVSGPSTYTLSNAASAIANVKDLVAGTYQFKLTVTDDKNASASTTVTITVDPAVNKPPVANAGTAISITLPTSSTDLDGSASSDPDGTIATYAWTLISGPAGSSITSASSAKTSVTGLTVAGQYKFQLTVKDNSGATATATVTVTVNDAANKTPIANAGKDVNITLPVNSVSLDGSGSSDPDGTIATWKWELTSGPAGSAIANAAVAKTTISNLVEGTYQMKLTITDNKGAVSSDVMTIIVQPAVNKPPVANAGTAISITLPTSSTDLDGSASSDPDGTIATYAWTLISGPAGSSITSASSAKTSVTGLTVAGQYKFQLIVKDNSGATATATVTVTVNDAANKTPIANAGKDVNITLPVNSVSLDGSGSSDPDGTIANWKWELNSGPAGSAIANAAVAKTTISNLVEGTYQLRLTITDNKGASSADVITITVLPAPAVNLSPVANAGTSGTIVLPYSNLSLNGSASNDPDGEIVSYTWEQTSGPQPTTINNANSEIATVPTLEAGTYVFRLTVKDDKGATASANVTLVVRVADMPNRGPVADAGSDQTVTIPQDYTQLDGSGSSDPDGSIVQYSWVQLMGPVTATLSPANATIAEARDLIPGIYTFELTVTDNEGAVSKDTVQVTVNFVTTRTDAHTTVLIYPNPFASQITMNLEGAQGAGSITIFDVNGRMIVRKEFIASDNAHQETMYLGNLQSGVYEAVIRIGKNYRITRKLVRQ